MKNRMGNIGDEPKFKQVDISNQINKLRDQATAKAHLTSQNKNSDGSIPNKGRNSLWKPGSRTFFRDQRARSIGDILKVKVEIQDQAKLDNKTERKRNSKTGMGIPNFFGLENKVPNMLSDAKSSNLIGIKGNNSANGGGKIDRKEIINTTIAATVINILPSNNLLIKVHKKLGLIMNCVKSL